MSGNNNNNNKNTRLLIVDTSTAMLHVLKTFAERQKYNADCFSDPDEASVALNRRFQDFKADYSCVVVGWPGGKLDLLAGFLDALNDPDHSSLPLIVVCQERADEVQALVNGRADTHAVLWTDHQQAAAIIERYSILSPDQPTVVKTTAGMPANNVPSITGAQPGQRTKRSVLLLDNVPSVCQTLRATMESGGYHVMVTATVASARAALKNNRIDLVVADFFLGEESGEGFCQYLVDAAEQSKKPACVVLTTKYSDSIVKRSLSAGAIACLYKNESTELLFSRIDALLRQVSEAPAKQENQNEQRILESIIDWVEPAAVVLDQNYRVLAANTRAAGLLELDSAKSLQGSDFTKVCPQVRNGEVYSTSVNATFARGGKSAVDVTYASSLLLKEEAQSIVMLTFEQRQKKVAQLVNSQNSGAAGQPYVVEESLPHVVQNTRRAAKPLERASVPGVVPMPQETLAKEVVAAERQAIEVKRKWQLNAIVEQKPDSDAPVPAPSASSPAESGPVVRVPVVSEQKIPKELDEKGFGQLLSRLLADKPTGLRRYLLMLDIQIIAVTGDRLCLGDSEPLLKIVNNALRKLYPRENSLAYLGNGQFGFVLASKSLQDALSLTRKLQQVVPHMVRYLSNMTLVSHGALMPLANDSTLGSKELMKQCRNACMKTRGDNRDNAVLVMSLNQYLTANSVKIANEMEVEKITG